MGTSSSVALRLVDGESPFETSRRCFEGIVKRLSEDDSIELRHEALEEVVEGHGRELLQSLIQDHIELRRLREEKKSQVQGGDGITRTHVRERKRRLTTIFGEVELQRLAYGADGSESLMPLDAQLNMPARSFSFGVQKRVAWEAARTSFDDGIETLGMQGIQIAKRQFEEVAIAAAVDFDAYYAIRDQLALGEPPPSPGEPSFLIISTDAKGIVMRPEDLREQTKKRAAEKPRKLVTRLAKGERPDRKRFAQVAAVYDVLPHIRRVEDILLLTRHLPADRRPAPPRATNKRVWASVEKDARTVISEAFDEAFRRDPDQKRPWAVLVDGGLHQHSYVRDCVRERGAEVTIIVDLIHVLEYLWEAGHCFEMAGTPELERWVLERLRAVLEGKAVDVAAGIRRSATLRKLKKIKRLGADKCANYLLRFKQFLDYPRYMKQGLPIATGVIEGTVRHLVQDRMDVTGARWGLNGAEAVLRLRALKASHDFHEYWEFHLEQEHKRNHADKYAAATPPVVLRPAKYRRGKDHLRLLEP